jgi:ACS family hexuronate transporter-like MFS transporter
MPLDSSDVATFSSPQADSGNTKSNVRWAVCGLLFLATTINYMDRSVLSILAPTLQSKLHWTEDQYAHIVMFFTIAYGIGFLTAGRLIDRIGTKVGYAISIFVWAIASMSHALVSTVMGFGIARFMLGLGESGNFPAAIKATTEWFPTEERALATGLFNSGANVAALIAPLFIPFITLRYGWHAAFIATGSCGMFWLIGWLFFPYNRLRRVATLTQQRLVLPATRHESEYLRIVLKHRGTWAFAIGKFVTDPVWWFYLFWLPKFFYQRFGLDLSKIGLPLVLVYFGSSIGSVAGGWLSGFLMKRGHSVNFGRKTAMLICGLCALPVVFADHVGNLWLAVALLGFAAAAHQGWSANLFSTPTDMFPSSSVSTVVGIGGTAGAIGGALFQLITGLVLQWTHNYNLLFAMASLAYVIALGIFQFLVPELGQPHKA